MRVRACVSLPCSRVICSYVIAFKEADLTWLRVSAAVYLELSDYEALAQVPYCKPQT